MKKEAIRKLLPDPRWEVPRYFSNKVIKDVADVAVGTVVNASAWRDEDKEGAYYRDYFPHATEYWVTNYAADARGWQGNIQNEIFLDLAQPLPAELKSRFDVVFNHTVLEHIFEVHQAFQNLCMMSKDVVLVVVPFVQEQHGEYGDYWRFTPLCVEKLFKQNGMKLGYVNWNDDKGAAVYIVAAAAKSPESTAKLRAVDGNRIDEVPHVFIGRRATRKPGLGKRILRSLLLHGVSKTVALASRRR